MEVLDFNGSGGPSSRDFTFAIKNNSTQNIRSSRSGSYVTVAGTTMRYIQPTQFHSYWTTPGAGLPAVPAAGLDDVEDDPHHDDQRPGQQLDPDLRDRKKATYRVVFPATGYATLGWPDVRRPGPLSSDGRPEPIRLRRPDVGCPP